MLIAHVRTLAFAICVLICVLFRTAESTLTENEQQQEDTFRSRTDDEWSNVWHQETHARCREKIVRHLYWACEKDIYKVSKKSDLEQISGKEFPFIEESVALSFLKPRRRNKRSSITNECCAVGCTWEEYAEYCPSNKRIRKFT